MDAALQGNHLPEARAAIPPRPQWRKHVAVDIHYIYLYNIHRYTYMYLHMWTYVRLRSEYGNYSACSLEKINAVSVQKTQCKKINAKQSMQENQHHWQNTSDWLLHMQHIVSIISAHVALKETASAWTKTNAPNGQLKKTSNGNCNTLMLSRICHYSITVLITLNCILY